MGHLNALLHRTCRRARLKVRAGGHDNGCFSRTSTACRRSSCREPVRLLPSPRCWPASRSPDRWYGRTTSSRDAEPGDVRRLVITLFCLRAVQAAGADERDHRRASRRRTGASARNLPRVSRPARRHGVSRPDEFENVIFATSPQTGAARIDSYPVGHVVASSVRARGESTTGSHPRFHDVTGAASDGVDVRTSRAEFRARRVGTQCPSSKRQVRANIPTSRPTAPPRRSRRQPGRNAHYSSSPSRGN